MPSTEGANATEVSDGGYVISSGREAQAPARASQKGRGCRLDRGLRRGRRKWVYLIVFFFLWHRQVAKLHQRHFYKKALVTLFVVTLLLAFVLVVGNLELVDGEIRWNPPE